MFPRSAGLVHSPARRLATRFCHAGEATRPVWLPWRLSGHEWPWTVPGSADPSFLVELLLCPAHFPGAWS